MCDIDIRARGAGIASTAREDCVGKRSFPPDDSENDIQIENKSEAFTKRYIKRNLNNMKGRKPAKAKEPEQAPEPTPQPEPNEQTNDLKLYDDLSEQLNVKIESYHRRQREQTRNDIIYLVDEMLKHKMITQRDKKQIIESL